MSKQRLNDTTAINDELLEELSAFVDGELDTERSRFLIQRLTHDDTLRTRWERWQLQSGAMRKMAQPVPADFADRVSRSLDAEPGSAAAGPIGRNLRWAGGAALAASLVVASVFVFDLTHAPSTASLPKIAAAATSIPLSIPITRTVLPQPSIKLPIPVRSGVVTAFRLPLHPVLQRELPQTHASFQPFPQPYAIDPELAAYLQNRKSGRTHDVFAEDAANNPVRTVAWPEQP